MRYSTQILPLFILLRAGVVVAQDCYPIDRVLHEFTYDYHIQQDSTSRNSMNIHEMVLQVGERSSKFLYHTDVFSDSIYHTMRDADAQTTVSLVVQHNMGTNNRTNLCNFSVYKNYPKKGGMLFTSILPGILLCEMHQPMNMRWTMQPGDTVILGYPCKRATTSFGGRSYVAWFTTQIPISDGPYKFHGLPGLIVRIADTRDEHVFVLKKVRNINWARDLVYRQHAYIEASVPQFRKAIATNQARMIDRIQRQEGVYGRVSDEVRARAIAKLMSRNNFIEKY